MIIDIFYWIFATLTSLCILGGLFLSFYLNQDRIINNHKYDKWYKFYNIIQNLIWVFLIICTLLLITEKFI